MKTETFAGNGSICTEVVLERLNGDRALMAKLAGFFLEDAPRLVETLRADIESGSAPRIAGSAHSLGGLASTFEAKSFTRLTTAIERNCRQGDTSEMTELMQQLDAEFLWLIADLREFVASPIASDGEPIR